MKNLYKAFFAAIKSLYNCFYVGKNHYISSLVFHSSSRKSTDSYKNIKSDIDRG